MKKLLAEFFTILISLLLCLLLWQLNKIAFGIATVVGVMLFSIVGAGVFSYFVEDLIDYIKSSKNKK